ncbi:Zinc finger, CCHC-type [Dillenia turbinata]|uniref:Zinc finger, CCHC-type n=1 Tax=Dillenia turbinata TaxID=194707 RepID=A0AAN8W161_9MAGN
MSLYLGNLSSHTRRDKLEHVFRAFGRCQVQVKDGYGFAVYDFPPDAEKALKALQGRNICGEPISITWSKKQPRSFQRFSSGGKSYDARGRNFSQRADYANRKRGSDDRRDHRTIVRHPDSDGNHLNPLDRLNEETAYYKDNVRDYMGEAYHNEDDKLRGEDGSIEPKLMADDGWGEQAGNQFDDNGIEHAPVFDRYEPDQVYDGRSGDGDGDLRYSCESHSPLSSRKKTKGGQIDEISLNRLDKQKPKKSCYTCGGSGHKRRNCPQKIARQREKSSRFEQRQNTEVVFRGSDEVEMKGIGYQPWRRQLSRRDARLAREHRKDNKVTDSRKRYRSTRGRDSSVTKELHRDQRRDDRVKMRKGRENGSPERHLSKRTRRSVSSAHQSDSVSSRFHQRSESPKSVQRSRSDMKMKSPSSGANPLSSRSKSGSASHNSRSRSLKSRSKPSSPTSLSISISLGQPLLSSPNKMQVNQKGPIGHATTPESNEVEVGRLVESDVGLENSILEKTTFRMSSGNATFAVDHVIHDHENSVPFSKAEDIQRQNDNQHTGSGIGLELDNSSTLVGNLPPNSFGETKVLEDAGAQEAEHMLRPTEKSESGVSLTYSSHFSSRTKISWEELCKVLKHYGLEHPEETEKKLPVEGYFGSARLWPWELIYYRKLRKGPISTENYARRIAQNREFGIVDKYIRSSSGWGEPDLDIS